MTTTPKTNEDTRLQEARESFSGRLLTDAQFEEAIAITRIIEREIGKSGTFKDKLGDYSYAMSRTERMDAVKAETIIRDLFKSRTGQTMNQMREKFAEREKNLPKDVKDKAYEHAARIGEHVSTGNKMTFFRASAIEAQVLGEALGITDAAAKMLMREAFKETEGSELNEWGKELDETYYRPQIEAEAQQRSQTHPEESTEPSPTDSERRESEPRATLRLNLTGAHKNAQSAAAVRRPGPRPSRG